MNLTTLQYHLYKYYLTSLFTVLLEQNLPFLILKGWSFIPDLYPDPATRPFSDVDMLIHPQDYNAVTARMAELGYTAKPSVRADSKPALSHIPLEVTWSHPAGVHIDLHTHILQLAWWHPAFPIDIQKVWDTCQPYQDSTGIQLHRLSPEVTFLHLCLHLWNHGPFTTSFHSYTDLVLLLRKYSKEMHWDLINQLTKDWHMQNLVYWVNQVLHRDFHTILPIEIQPKSHPKSLQYRLIQTHFVRVGLAPTPWRSAFLLRLALIDDLTLLPKLLFSALFPNPTLRTAIHNQPRTLLQHWTTYTRRLLRQ